MLKSFDSLFDKMIDETFDNVFYKDLVHMENVDGAKKLYIDLPGVKKEDIKVDASGDTLRIAAERKIFMKRKFDKTYHLPASQYDVDSIAAEYTDGVLVLTLPLAASKAKKTINVK